MLCQALEKLGRSWYSVYRKNEKVGNRGNREIPMIFVGYAKNHARDCYCLYNPTKGYMTEMRRIVWMHNIYYSKPEVRDEVLVYPQVALPLKLEDAEAREGLTLNASEPKIKFQDNEKEWGIVCTRLDRVLKPLVLFMKENSSDGVEGALSTIYQNYTQLCKLNNVETKNIDIAAVGVGLDSRLDHTSKLKVIKFKEAMNGPDSNKWKEKIENEHKRMMTNGA